jgi:hypothetical protein
MNRKALLSIVTLLVSLSLAGNPLGQAHPTSSPAPPSTITRPDSIQDTGMYNYWAGMSGQGRADGALLENWLSTASLCLGNRYW